MDENVKESNSMLSWAEKEIALAIASEKEASEGSDEWEYGVGCYQSAIKAFRSLVEDKHSGMSIQITKGILNRLIDGKCLTPIEDTDDIWSEVTWKEGGDKEYQCNRMSSLFKKVTVDGEVIYSDINRVQCVDINNPKVAYQSGFATRLIDKIFPIAMPYLPTAKPFRLFREEFLVNPKAGDYDTVAYLYILMPDGQKVELNRYFKEDASGQIVPIKEEEYKWRKAKAEKKTEASSKESEGETSND
jgi:hypothetical protein